MPFRRCSRAKSAHASLQGLSVQAQDDTLIVIPNGDSLQVLESDLRREVDALHKMMDAPGLINVVVDVGNAPHYGSLVIGAIMALCKKANNRGGLAAFCNASDGMLDMLQIMKIDSVMPYYPTRREARSTRSIGRARPTKALHGCPELRRIPSDQLSGSQSYGFWGAGSAPGAGAGWPRSIAGPPVMGAMLELGRRRAGIGVSAAAGDDCGDGGIRDASARGCGGCSAAIIRRATSLDGSRAATRSKCRRAAS